MYFLTVEQIGYQAMWCFQALTQKANPVRVLRCSNRQLSTFPVKHTGNIIDKKRMFLLIKFITTGNGIKPDNYEYSKESDKKIKLRISNIEMGKSLVTKIKQQQEQWSKVGNCGELMEVLEKTWGFKLVN